MSSNHQNNYFFNPKKRWLATTRPSCDSSGSFKFLRRKSLPKSFCSTKTILSKYWTRGKSVNRWKQFEQIIMAQKTLHTLLQLAQSSTMLGPWRKDRQKCEPVNVKCKYSTVCTVRDTTWHEFGNRSNSYALPTWLGWTEQQLLRRAQQQQHKQHQK